RHSHRRSGHGFLRRRGRDALRAADNANGLVLLKAILPPRDQLELLTEVVSRGRGIELDTGVMALALAAATAPGRRARASDREPEQAFGDRKSTRLNSS